MLDQGRDQAAGLRHGRWSGTESTSGHVCPILGATDHPLAVAGLLAALVAAGWAPGVVSDCPQVLRNLQGLRHTSLTHIWSGDTIEWRKQGSHDAWAPRGLTWWAMHDQRLQSRVSWPTREALVWVSDHAESLALAYARIKAWQRCAPVHDVWMVWLAPVGRDAGVGPQAYQRLAKTLARFLGLRLHWAGMVPDAGPPEVYRSLAHRLGVAAFHQGGEAACQVH